MSNNDEILMTQQEYELLKEKMQYFYHELFLYHKGFQNLIQEFEKIYGLLKK